MSVQLNKLLANIEECREKMIKLAKTSSYSNQTVVEVSTKLDTLLNHYQQMTEKKQ